jgi:L-iditol 2-dehydrogenase
VVFAGHGSTDGAMRELMAWPPGRLHPLPDDVADACGALLEPLGVAIQCLDMGYLPFGGSGAVAGCGPIGLLLIQLLRLSGASSVLAVEPLPHRREAALRAGATTAAAPAAGAAGLAGYGVDVAFEAAGTGDAVRFAIAAARPGGRVVLAGIPADDTVTFPASAARRKGLTIALVRRMNQVYPRAISLAARGAVDLASLVTSQVPLGEAAGAFGAAAQRTGLKTLIQPQR